MSLQGARIESWVVKQVLTLGDEYHPAHAHIRIGCPGARR